MGTLKSVAIGWVLQNIKRSKKTELLNLSSVEFNFTIMNFSLLYQTRSLINSFETEAITSYFRPNVVKPKIYAVKNVFFTNPTFFCWTDCISH